MKKIPKIVSRKFFISFTEIYGMEGIPEQDLKDHERQKGGADDDPEDGGPMAKMAKTDGNGPGGVPGMGGQVRPGFAVAG